MWQRHLHISVHSLQVTQFLWPVNCVIYLIKKKKKIGTLIIRLLAGSLFTGKTSLWKHLYFFASQLVSTIFFETLVFIFTPDSLAQPLCACVYPERYMSYVCCVCSE